MEITREPPSLRTVISAALLLQPVYVAAKLQIADYLSSGKRSIKDLAALTGVNAKYLYRVMSALANNGIFNEESGEFFALSESARLLRKDVNGSLWSTIIRAGEEFYLASGGLLEGVKRGTTPFNNVFGKTFFEYVVEHRDFADGFDSGMAEMNRKNIEAVMQHFNFKSIRTLADIGGGTGQLIREILIRYPHINGVLFDLPHVIDKAREDFEKANLSDRCQCVAGNFFGGIPVEADAYLFSKILHDWQDSEAKKILQHTVDAMGEASKVIILETVIGHNVDLQNGKLFDLGMLIMTGGIERTRQQFEGLLKSVGLEIVTLAALNEQVTFIECIKKNRV